MSALEKEMLLNGNMTVFDINGGGIPITQIPDGSPVAVAFEADRGFAPLKFMDAWCADTEPSE